MEKTNRLLEAIRLEAKELSTSPFYTDREISKVLNNILERMSK